MSPTITNLPDVLTHGELGNGVLEPLDVKPRPDPVGGVADVNRTVTEVRVLSTSKLDRPAKNEAQELPLGGRSLCGSCCEV